MQYSRSSIWDGHLTFTQDQSWKVKIQHTGSTTEYRPPCIFDGSQFYEWVACSIKKYPVLYLLPYCSETRVIPNLITLGFFKNVFSLHLGRIKGYNDIYHTLSLCLLYDYLLNAVKCLASLSHGNPIYGIKSPSFAWLALIWLHRLHACFTKDAQLIFIVARE